MNFWNKKKDLLGGSRNLMTGTLKTDFDFKKYNDKNIFNRISEGSTYGF